MATINSICYIDPTTGRISQTVSDYHQIDRSVLPYGIIYGVTTVNFGSGANTATSTVSAAAGKIIDHAAAWVSAADSTSGHTPNDHTYFQLFASFPISYSAGTSFIINAVSRHRLTGTFSVRYFYTYK